MDPRRASEIGLRLPADDQGLYRTTLAGPGSSLADAFEELNRSKRVQRLLSHPVRDVLSARVTLAPEEGEGYWELTRVRDEIFIILSDFRYRAQRMEWVPGDGLIQFNFRISGDLTYGADSPGPLRFNRPALHLWRQSEGTGIPEWTAASSHERMVTLCVRPRYLEQHFLELQANSSTRLRSFVAGTRPDKPMDCWELLLTGPMFETIGRMLSCSYQDPLYLVQQEALAQDLLCAAVELCSRPARSAQVPSEREARVLSEVRELLMSRLSDPPSVAEVARRVGLSQKGLTQTFRASFGESVYDFGLRCRMQRAISLLRDHHVCVDEVSHAVGYAQPTSFATAFRRHFGFRPLDVKPRKARARGPKDAQDSKEM